MLGMRAFPILPIVGFFMVIRSGLVSCLLTVPTMPVTVSTVGAALLSIAQVELLPNALAARLMAAQPTILRSKVYFLEACASEVIIPIQG